MQLRDSSSRSATDGADQHTRCGKGEKKTIAPETNSSGQPAPDLEEVCGFSVSNKKFFFKNILALQRKPVVSRARARFDYVASPDDPSELSFKRGEIVQLCAIMRPKTRFPMSSQGSSRRFWKVVGSAEGVRLGGASAFQLSAKIGYAGCSGGGAVGLSSGF